MRYVFVFLLLAAGLMGCSSDQSPKVEIENCVLPPTPTIPPIGIFNSKRVNGTVYFAYTTCGLNIYTKNSETFKAEQVSKISIKTNQLEIVVQKFTKPTDLNALSIKIKASLLTDYISVFNSLRNGKASFIIYSSEAVYGEVATLICGNKECGT